MILLDCPAFLNHECTVRCGLPAEVRCRFTIHSADGPLEGAMIRCPAGHYFNGPIEYGPGGIAVRDLPAEPEAEISRSNTAPAYYLGRPARLWITVMRPRRRAKVPATILTIP